MAFGIVKLLTGSFVFSVGGALYGGSFDILTGGALNGGLVFTAGGALYGGQGDARLSCCSATARTMQSVTTLTGGDSCEFDTAFDVRLELDGCDRSNPLEVPLTSFVLTARDGGHVGALGSFSGLPGSAV